MKVKDLVRRLLDMPQNAETLYVYDGAARSDVAEVWISKGGAVVLAGEGRYVYDDEDAPAGSNRESEITAYTVRSR